MRKNVLLLFAKLPEPGLVKTRLTIERGGVLKEEDASRLFEAMLLDVVEVSLKAFARLSEGEPAPASWDSGDCSQYPDSAECDCYELVVSTAPAANAPAMRELLEHEFGPATAKGDDAPFPIRVISDSGASFDEHYNDAFAQCWEAGADCILSMGADMPALTVDDAVRGFRALHELDEADGGIVLAPDQEMGVSIVGWPHTTAFDHTGVFYNPTGLTVLPAYVEKARDAGLPVLYLPPVPDVDTMADLMHNITLVNALDYCAQFDDGYAPVRTLEVLRDLGLDEVRVPPNDLLDPRDAIDR